jgi:hypothetical protein
MLSITQYASALIVMVMLMVSNTMHHAIQCNVSKKQNGYKASLPACYGATFLASFAFVAALLF